MNTKFEFIHFVQRPTKSPAAVTTAWACLNNRTNDQLGTIAWYGPWRQYCYWPIGTEVYSKGCLSDIEAFIGQLMDDRKLAHNAKAVSP